MAADTGDRLSAVVAQLAGDVAVIAERLVVGRRQYGELRLATDRRDWVHEAADEAADLSVYLAAALIRARS